MMAKRYFKATTRAGVTAIMSSGTRDFAVAVIRVDDGRATRFAFYEGTDSARRSAAKAAKARPWDGPGEICDAVEISAATFKAIKHELENPIEPMWGDGGHDLDEYCDRCSEVLEAGQIGECDDCQAT
ncbi:MAG: hypothetical protein B7Z40_15485 [Bosea sp. 12-68-7]|nr:MAG: hypothetical protein B7Z40_15485 [Bosea sp. 12-68-7]